MYPSAIYRLPGFLRGLPNVLKPNQLNMDFLSTTHGYFIKIQITKVGIHRDFPLLSYVVSRDEAKTSQFDEGVRNWTNDMVGRRIYVDNITLEDLVTFQHVEYKIICGYYYRSGLNNKQRDAIKKLYDRRLELKNERNPAQACIKLCLNSKYNFFLRQ